MPAVGYLSYLPRAETLALHSWAFAVRFAEVGYFIIHAKLIGS